MHGKKTVSFEDFARDLKNDSRNDYHLKYIGCEGKDEDFLGSNNTPMILTTFTTVENPELFVIISTKKDDYYALELDDVTNTLFELDNKKQNNDATLLKQKSKHILEELVSLGDIVDTASNYETNSNKTPKFGNMNKKKSNPFGDTESEDDFNTHIQDLKVSKPPNSKNKSHSNFNDFDSENDSVGGTDNDAFKPKILKNTASNKSAKSNKSITFVDVQDNANKIGSRPISAQHKKSQQSQHSNRSSKSGAENLFTLHKAKNASVDFSTDHKDIEFSEDNASTHNPNEDMDNVNTPANNKNNNDAKTKNDAKNKNDNVDNESKNDSGVTKTLEELCEVLGELEANIDVVEQTLSHNTVITFRAVALENSLSRKKSSLRATQFKDWSGFDVINKDSNLLFEDSYFDEGFLIEDSFVMVKFDFTAVSHLREKWDNIVDSFGSSSSIQHIINSILKGEKDIHVEVMDKIAKDAAIIMVFTSSS